MGIARGPGHHRLGLFRLGLLWRARSHGHRASPAHGPLGWCPWPLCSMAGPQPGPCARPGPTPRPGQHGRPITPQLRTSGAGSGPAPVAATRADSPTSTKRHQAHATCRPEYVIHRPIDRGWFLVLRSSRIPAGERRLPPCSLNARPLCRKNQRPRQYPPRTQSSSCCRKGQSKDKAMRPTAIHSNKRWETHTTYGATPIYI